MSKKQLFRETKSKGILKVAKMEFKMIIISLLGSQKIASLCFYALCDAFYWALKLLIVKSRHRKNAHLKMATHPLCSLKNASVKTTAILILEKCQVNI